MTNTKHKRSTFINAHISGEKGLHQIEVGAYKVIGEAAGLQKWKDVFVNERGAAFSISSPDWLYIKSNW